MHSENNELVKAGHELAKCLDNEPLIDIAKMIIRLSDKLDVTTAALREKTKQCDALAKQNIAEREKDIAALDEVRQRIADLESKLAQSESWAVSAQSYIASLESRTIRLPFADIGTAKEFYEDAVVVPLIVVNEACAAAGINLETGGEA